MPLKMMTKQQFEELEFWPSDDRELVEYFIEQYSTDPDSNGPCSQALRGYIVDGLLFGFKDKKERHELDGAAASFCDGWEQCLDYLEEKGYDSVS